MYSNYTDYDADYSYTISDFGILDTSNVGLQRGWNVYDALVTVLSPSRSFGLANPNSKDLFGVAAWTFNQVVNCSSFTVENTFFGGCGTGTFILNASPEETKLNLTATNRIDAFIRRTRLLTDSYPVTGLGSAVFHTPPGSLTSVTGANIGDNITIPVSYATGLPIGTYVTINSIQEVPGSAGNSKSCIFGIVVGQGTFSGGGTSLPTLIIEVISYNSGSPGNLIADNVRYPGVTCEIDPVTILYVAPEAVDRLSPGMTIACYDGINLDVAQIQSAGYSTNIPGMPMQLDETPYLYLQMATLHKHHYQEGTTVLRKIYSGRINDVQNNYDLQNSQTVITKGFFTELKDLTVENAQFVTGWGTGYEAGFVILQLLQSYSDEFTGFYFVSAAYPNFSNIVYSSSGNPASGGTGQPMEGNYQGSDIMSIINDAVNQANGGIDAAGGSGDSSGGTTKTIYRAFCDENNLFFFEAINLSTPTLTAYVDGYSVDVLNDGLYDCVKSYKNDNNNTDQMYNTILAIGGQDPTSGNPVNVVVFDQLSVNVYGNIQVCKSNSNCMSVDSLTAWAQNLLSQNAYPTNKIDLVIEPSLSYLTCEDYIAVTGFNNSDVDTFTPQSVETKYDSSNPGIFSQHIIGRQILPDINRLMNNMLTQAVLSGQNPMGRVGLLSSNGFVQSGLSSDFLG